MSSTGAEAELNALRQLFAQQSQELQKERATSVDEEGGAKRSGSVLDLLANAAAQTG